MTTLPHCPEAAVVPVKVQSGFLPPGRYAAVVLAALPPDALVACPDELLVAEARQKIDLVTTDVTAARSIDSERVAAFAALQNRLFLAAAADASLGALLLRPPVFALAQRVAALRRRWQELAESLAVPRIELPEPAGDWLERDEDLSAWPEKVQADVLSLDVFDTCLNRYVAKPTDVYQLVGAALYSLTGLPAAEFAEQRHSIEQDLRARLRPQDIEDVTHEAIYAAMAEKFSWDEVLADRIRHYELALETLLLHAVEEVRGRAWAWVASGRPLIYVSEMYLDAATIGGLLRQNGFPVDGCRIFTSGETGKSKGTGNLFRLASEEMPTARLLHVGDNPHSDANAASLPGWQAAIIRTRRRLHSAPLANLFEAAAQDGYDCARKATPEEVATDFWESFGQRIAGPLHAAYAGFLLQLCAERDLPVAWFLARDGWFTRQAFDRMAQAWNIEVESHYVYASREYWGLGSMREIDAAAWDFLLKPGPLIRAADVCERIGIAADCYVPACRRHGISDPRKRLCHHWGFADPESRNRLYRVICDCIDAVITCRDRMAGSLQDYLDALGILSGKGLVVDLGWQGTLWKALQRLRPAARPGLAAAFFAYHGLPAADIHSFTGPAHSVLLRHATAVLEFVFGSPEPSVSCMQRDGAGFQPVFRGRWPEQQVAAWNAMGRGIDRFLERLLMLQSALPLQPRDALAAAIHRLYQLVCRPTPQQARLLGEALHAEAWGCSHYLKLAPELPQPLTPELYREALLYAPWKAGLQARNGAAINSR